MTATSKNKKLISEYHVYSFSFMLWGIHFLCIAFQTLSQCATMEKVEWEKTLYKRHGLSNVRGGGTNNHTFINTETEFEVTRSYSSISGVNKSLWGLKKAVEPVGVSFYLRKEDYRKMQMNVVDYQLDLLGNQTINKAEIPFFALRINQTPASTFSVLTDLWKYHYSIYTLLYLLIPQAISLVNKKRRFFNYRRATLKQSKMIGVYCALLILTLVVNLMV